jgi:hypothetical protein
LHKRIIVYALLSKKQKQDQTQKKRGQLLIHIPGAWSYPQRKQVTSTYNANVCMFVFDSFCDQALECLINSKRYILPTKVIPPPCTQGAAEASVVYYNWQYLNAKIAKK